MIRQEETGVPPLVHTTVLAYEAALLQEYLDSLDKPSGFTQGTIKAVQAFLLDRIEIIATEEGLHG